jgi:coenzyme F420-reducing hydrogenase beta subunit
MRTNAEGFLMPIVDSERCSDCGVCESTCPYLNSPRGLLCSLQSKNAYIYFAPNDEAVKKSTSGGVFYGLAQEVLHKGGYVCGCVWSDKLMTRHIVSNDIQDIERMQGSKYVQSDLGGCFVEIRELLVRGKSVLFSGTPCQVAGIQSCLPDELMKRLITLSIICHGVPSPKVWRGYVDELERERERERERESKSRLYSVNMRSKVRSYHKPMCEYRFEDGHILYTAYEDKYMFGFLENLYLRKSCYDCKFKDKSTSGDIICGDCHDGYRMKTPAGASVILALSEKGDQALHSSFKENLIKFDARQIICLNDMLIKSVPINKQRSRFFKTYKNGFSFAFFDCIKKRYWVKTILRRLHLFHFAQSIWRSVNH